MQNTPWTLHFDRDGTEDFAIITDAEGNDLAASHLPSTRIADRTHASGTFWRPEEGGKVPAVLEAMVMMHAAPLMLEALQSLVTTVMQQKGIQQAQIKPGSPLERAQAAITAATDCEPYRIKLPYAPGEPVEWLDEPF